MTEPRLLECRACDTAWSDTLGPTCDCCGSPGTILRDEDNAPPAKEPRRKVTDKGPRLLERDLKEAVTVYLKVEEARGHLMWMRLNSGGTVINDAKYGRRFIGMCRPGTADYLIVRRGRAIFVELKGPNGKQTPEQHEFCLLADHHGADYWLVRSLDELRANLLEVEAQP